MSHNARSHASGADVPAVQPATLPLGGAHQSTASLSTTHKVKNVLAANSERPGQGRPTGRRLPPFGHRDQAVALSQFPGSFARASDGFCLLAGLAFRRFFIRLAALHLTKNALALHLPFEDPESLIDVVVSNDDLQNVSNLLLALGAPSS